MFQEFWPEKLGRWLWNSSSSATVWFSFKIWMPGIIFQNNQWGIMVYAPRILTCEIRWIWNFYKLLQEFFKFHCCLMRHSMATANLKKVRTSWQIPQHHQSTFHKGLLVNLSLCNTFPCHACQVIFCQFWY